MTAFGTSTSSLITSSTLSLSSSCRKTQPANDVLIGLVVSRWDNILGPQCIYLWTEEKTSCFNPADLPSNLDCLVKYVTDHTVDHHDIIVEGYLLTPATCRHTLCLVYELNLAYISLSIRVPSDPNVYTNNNYYNGGGGSNASTITGVDYQNYIGSNSSLAPSTVPHAVSILVNLSLLPHFLLMRPLVTNWLAEFGPKLSILLCKNQLQSSMINSWCAELCKTMTTIRSCWSNREQQQMKISPERNPQHQQQQQNGSVGAHSSSSRVVVSANSHNRSHYHRRTSLVRHRKIRPAKRKPDRSKNSQLDFLPPIWPNRSCFEAILTSHLSTSGSSLVVGNDINNMNQVIRFLLCFSKSEEGYCSKYVHPALPDTFMKGLFVQGLITGEIGERSLTLYHVSSNRYPLTHVELKHKNSFKIRQSPHISLHKQRRDNILIQELVNLWNLAPFVHPVLEPFPKSVCDITAKFVSKFLNDLLLLEPDKRYGRLILFKRSLHAKAISLIAYLNSISHKPIKQRCQLVKDLKEMMRYDDNEFVIIQMTSEKLRPGIISRLRTSSS